MAVQDKCSVVGGASGSAKVAPCVSPTVLLLAALIISACVPVAADVTLEGPADTESPPRPQPRASEWVLAARDAALVYLSQRYSEQAPPLGLAWVEEYTTPEGWVGSATFEFASGDWVVTVTYAILPPERTVYQVVVANQASGFQWEGKVTN